MSVRSLEEHKLQAAVKLLNPIECYYESNDWMFTEAKNNVICLCDMLGFTSTLKSENEASARCVEIIQSSFPKRQKAERDEDLYTDGMDSYYPPSRLPRVVRSFENRKYLFIMSMFKMIYDTHCLGGRCEEDSVREYLCEECRSLYLYHHNLTGDTYCNKCKAIFREYTSAKESGFCLNCIKNRFLQSYNNLCYYVKEIDCAGLFAQGEVDVILSLMEVTLSILMHELGVIKNAEDNS